jgi:prepilin-type processing-associated H-X9-DG protein
MVELVAVLSVSTVALSLASPAIQAAREASRRTMCKNNLKQIGLALHNYHDTYRCFAPGWTNHSAAPGAGTRFGWSATILPYADQYPLYELLDFNAHQISSRTAVETAVPIYRCAADTSEATNPRRGGFATSNYSGNFGTVAPPRWLTGSMNPAWPGEASTPLRTNGIFWLNSSTRIRSIVDGTSNTILVGERSVSGGAGIWMGVRGNNFENDQVTDCSPGNEMNSGLGAFSSRHKGGANFLFCDGAVRWLSEDLDSGRAGVYQNLSDREDSRVVGEF